jgi:hypothetical protein
MWVVIVFALAVWHNGFTHKSIEMFILARNYVLSGGREICQEFGGQ